MHAPQTSPILTAIPTLLWQPVRARCRAGLSAALMALHLPRQLGRLAAALGSLTLATLAGTAAAQMPPPLPPLTPAAHMAQAVADEQAEVIAERVDEKLPAGAGPVDQAALDQADTPLPAGFGARVGDFSLLDQAGYYHNMSWYDDHAAIALLVQANDGEQMAARVAEFAALQTRYGSAPEAADRDHPGRANRADRKASAERTGRADRAGRGADRANRADRVDRADRASRADRDANRTDRKASANRTDGTSHSGPQTKIKFLMINPMGRHNRAAVAAELAKYDVTIPVLMDDARVISQALGVDTIGELFLFNPSSFRVEYRGPVAQAEAALEAIVNERRISNPAIAVTGSPVNYPVAEAHAVTPPSYVQDIAPIIAENCASCHREGGIAPFAMNSHTMMKGWSPMIREVLMTKRMPPGQIDPHVGEFVNDMLLSDREVQQLLHWIEAGSPHDGSSDPLTELTWPQSKWAFGEPDYIIKVPAQTIPPTGVLDYIYVSVPIDIEQDRWVRASQYVAGDRTVLHHTLNALAEPGETRRRRFLGAGKPDQANITAYIPGAEPVMEPPNTGGLLKKGSTLNLQLHYTTNGKETVDASEIGLWFYPEGEVPAERMAGECACIFPDEWTNIPPGDPNFEQSTSITLREDAHLHSFTPHMHFRGKYMRFHATYPDGRTEQLINIANYGYNWQLAYTYAEPKFMPAGTVLTATGAYDNSSQNPLNPDPTRAVPWGQQSWDEMFFGAMTWKYTNQTGQD